MLLTAVLTKQLAATSSNTPRQLVTALVAFVGNYYCLLLLVVGRVTSLLWVYIWVMTAAALFIVFNSTW